MQNFLNKTEVELRIRNYSPRTVKSYLYALKEYFTFKKNNLKNPDIEDIKKFLLVKQKYNLSPQTINLYLNAIKFFCREIIKTSKRIDIKFAKITKRLPAVLSRNEIEKIISVTNNPKHKLLLSLANEVGFRVSEVVNFKIKDINIKELTIHLKQTKGKKDRLTIFPEKLKTDIQKLIAGKDKDNLVFISKRGREITTKTAQKVFESSLKKSGIKKDATFHSLRHSFATHLLENGIEVRYVQELLSHRNIRTTQIYTQVTNPKLKNIKSPFDF